MESTDNVLRVHKKIFDCIDALPDADSAKAAANFFNNDALKKIFWQSFKTYFTTKNLLERQKARLKCIYINRYFNSGISFNSKIQPFTTPHGFYGIFISEAAKIGKGCTIFHQVTIGSNTLPDSKNAGAPTIGDNVYIGAGAKIIGNIKIGNNVRIGAGCVVTRDVPDNCTVVPAANVIIQKDAPQDNRWLSIGSYLKLKAASKNNPAPPPVNYKPLTVTVFAPQEKNIFRAMDSATQSAYDGAFKILFCGDLILLEDQVKRAFDGKGYDFDELFEFTKKYISAADFSIGVFEGPLGGNKFLYSQSNFGDGTQLRLNFPDTFADAVKNAGFDLVTTANNHMLDMRLDGLNRTIRVLREKGLDFIGTYSDAEDKAASHVKLIERGELKLAILAYTYGTNRFKFETLISDEYSYTTSVICSPDNPAYEKILADVQKDFELAKSLNPDLIIVLPHWGTQFVDEPNAMQKSWRETFLSLGADIILGDHTHSVQPVKIETVDGRETYTLYSPGNYANVYRKHDGDASLMAEIYIDRATKKIIGGAIIPMWTQSKLDGNYRALPVHEILTNTELRNEISTHELERVNYVLKHITRVALGTELDTNFDQQKYFFDGGGFMRSKVAPLTITDEMRGDFYAALTAAENVCFVGDSLTEGTRNGGVPWYEPIENLVRGKIFNCSRGGATTKFLLAHRDEIANVPADLFVVAIGTNDVRYRKPDVCAMTPEEYIDNLQKLRDTIREKNPAAKFVFIAPWTSTDGDKFSALPYLKKIQMNNAYSDVLGTWCAAQGDMFINANGRIKVRLNKFPRSDYLVDHIHPNAGKGVAFYSAAVLTASK